MHEDDYSNVWPTNCEEIDGWNIDNCCGSCHGDAFYGIEPCEIEYKGETKFVCCTCYSYMRDNNLLK